MASFPAPSDGIVLTHFIVSRDVERSRRFYAEVLGGEVVREGEPSAVALANGWIIINVGGGPTEDKPEVTLRAPEDPTVTSSFLNIRVADIEAVSAEWSARGAEFLTPPMDRGREIRCYLRDPDGHLIEVGQTVAADGPSAPPAGVAAQAHEASAAAGEAHGAGSDPPGSDPLQFTGLERMRAIAEGSAPPAPIQRLLGFHLVEAAEGRVAFVCTPTAAMRNPLGSIHGGIAMTLLDSATGAAVHTTLVAGQAYATLETKVNLVRAITPQTGEVRAEGTVVHRGGRVATAEARLIDGAGALLAHATSTCLIRGD